MFIAVWSSILLHAALFTGFSLIFSNGRESFPETEPLVVSGLSVTIVTDKIAFPRLYPEDKNVADKKNISIPVPSPAIQEEVIESEETIARKVPDKAIPDNSEGDITGIVENNSNSNVPSVFNSNYLKREAAPVEIKEPFPVGTIVPVYPFRARKKGLEGDVVLEVVVSGTGKPVSCVVINSSGSEDLDKAAEQSILASLFYPGTVDGVDVESSLKITIRFQLNES